MLDRLNLPESSAVATQDILLPVTRATGRYRRLPNEQVETAICHDLALMFRWFNQIGESGNPNPEISLCPVGSFAGPVAANSPAVLTPPIPQQGSCVARAR